MHNLHCRSSHRPCTKESTLNTVTRTWNTTDTVITCDTLDMAIGNENTPSVSRYYIWEVYTRTHVHTYTHTCTHTFLKLFLEPLSMLLCNILFQHLSSHQRAPSRFWEDAAPHTSTGKPKQCFLPYKGCPCRMSQFLLCQNQTIPAQLCAC